MQLRRKQDAASRIQLTPERLYEFNEGQKDKFAKATKQLNLNEQHLNKAVRMTREKRLVNEEYGKHKLFCHLFLIIVKL